MTNAFLQQMTRHLMETVGWSQLGSLTLVVPSRRAVLFVKDCLRALRDEQGLKMPVRLPEMTTLSLLIDDLSPLYKADELMLVTTLYKVYNEVLHPDNDTDRLPLDMFYGWGRQMVQDFSNIDKAYPLVEPEAFLGNTVAARELEKLDIDPDIRERLTALVAVRQEDKAVADSKRREFEALWTNLPRIFDLFRERLGQYSYEGARISRLLQEWDTENVQRKLAGKMFVFAGFNYLVPAEKAVLHRLQDAGQAQFYWDYPLNFTANSRAFKWIVANAREFGNALTVTDWQPHKPVEIISAASSHAQAQYVHEWLLAHHHKGERTAIVICDESALERVIYALPSTDDERFKHINITKGFPMRQTVVFAKVMNWLMLKQNDRVGDETYSDVLKRMLDWLQPTPTAEEIAPEQEETVSLTWHELLAQESLFQLTTAVNRFRLLLDSSLMPYVTGLRTLRMLLRRYLEGISFPFHGEPLTEIQVTGVLETRAMDFDNILLLNVEEGVVPNTSADLSYIPYYLRKAYGLETHEEAADVYAYNFFRLIRRAKTVTLLFTGSESQTGKTVMSRFVKQIMHSSDFEVTKRILVEPDILPAAAGTPAEKLVTGEPVFRMLKRLQLSPSALGTYRQCQMRFYLQSVLRIPETQPNTLLLSPPDMGTLLHRAMQQLYLHHAPATLPTDSSRWCEEALQEAFAILFPDRNITRHPLELAAIRTYMQRITDYDRQLAQTQGLQILNTEKDYYMPVELPEIGTVRVGGIIDRIDQVGSTVRLVDYKTGAYKKDYDEQLLIYREAYGKQPATVLYMAAAKDLIHAVDPQPDFIDALKTELTEIMNLTQPAFAQNDQPCKYCPYKILCTSSTPRK